MTSGQLRYMLYVCYNYATGGVGIVIVTSHEFTLCTVLQYWHNVHNMINSDEKLFFHADLIVFADLRLIVFALSYSLFSKSKLTSF